MRTVFAIIALLACTIIALLACAGSARATQQIREEIVVDGRYTRMEATPLRAWLATFDKTPWERKLGSTALWRGYVGTWLIEDDRLYLLSMRQRARAGWEQIPLSLVFPKTRAPVLATWYSGTLVLPVGDPIRSLRNRRRVLHPKTLHVEIADGRVTSRRVVDHHLDNAMSRSFEDLRWVARASKRPPDGVPWHDARLVGSEAFRKAVPVGALFRTRGYVVSGKGWAFLRVPDAPAVSGTSLALDQLPDATRSSSLRHVEVEATWKPGQDAITLDVASVRALKPGESMHHPTYVLPPGAAERARQVLRKRASAVDAEGARDRSFGAEIALRGTLVAGRPSTVLGVDVGEAITLVGKQVVVTGVLQRWMVTPTLLETNAEVAKWVGARGPGDYFRLIDPTTGALSKPASDPSPDARLRSK